MPVEMKEKVTNKEDKNKEEELVILVNKLDIFQEIADKEDKEVVEKCVITVSKLDTFLLTVKHLNKKENQVKEENVSDVVIMDMSLMIVNKHEEF